MTKANLQVIEKTSLIKLSNMEEKTPLLQPFTRDLIDF